jgi:hypothetical protein
LAGRRAARHAQWRQRANADFLAFQSGVTLAT